MKSTTGIKKGEVDNESFSNQQQRPEGRKHRHSNQPGVFDELNKEGIQTEMIQFAGQVIEPCKTCWACGEQQNCVHRKDNFRDIFDKMKKADGILLGSPVYSANISANMQALWERAAVVCAMNPDLLIIK